MSTGISRRSLLRAGLVAGGAVSGVALLQPGATAAHSRLRELEVRYGVRLGVYAKNLVTGRVLAQRQDERFPICSVFKPLAVAAILRDRGDLLERPIAITQEDIVVNSPITAPKVGSTMTVRELSDAAIRFSDNTAGNLLLRLIGGPAGVTRFARSIGDDRTRLDRWEPFLNSAVPGDPQDTTTPAAIASSYRKILLGSALSPCDSRLVRDWMLANQTSFTRFRAGLPAGWTLADKTGAGAFAALNDAGVAWRPDGVPVLIVALSAADQDTVIADNKLMADVASVVASTL